MRDVKRLDDFYDKLKQIHSRSFADWRFGQLMLNFLGECGDPFYWEEDEFISKLKKYANKYSHYYKWED
jgi:hypothetical protein